MNAKSQDLGGEILRPATIGAPVSDPACLGCVCNSSRPIGDRRSANWRRFTLIEILVTIAIFVMKSTRNQTLDPSLLESASGTAFPRAGPTSFLSATG